MSNAKIKEFIACFNRLVLLNTSKDASMQAQKIAAINSLLQSLRGHEAALPSDAVFMKLEKESDETRKFIQTTLSEDRKVQARVDHSHTSVVVSADQGRDPLLDEVDGWDVVDISVSESPTSSVSPADSVRSMPFIASTDSGLPEQEVVVHRDASPKKWPLYILIGAAIALGVAALIVASVFTSGIVLVPAAVAAKVALSCFVAGGVLLGSGMFAALWCAVKSCFTSSSGEVERKQFGTHARVGADIPPGTGRPHQVQNLLASTGESTLVKRESDHPEPGQLHDDHLESGKRRGSFGATF